MAEIQTAPPTSAKKQYDLATLKEIGKLPICHIRPPNLSSCCAIPTERGLREELTDKDIILSPPRKAFPSAQENKDYNKNDVFHGAKPRWDPTAGKSNMQNKDRRFQDGQGHHEGNDRRFDRHLGGRGNDRREGRDGDGHFGTGDPRRDRELERQGHGKDVHTTQGWNERWGDRPVAHPRKDGEREAVPEADKASHSVPAAPDSNSEPKPKAKADTGDSAGTKTADPSDVDAWFGKADPLADDAAVGKSVDFDLGVDLISSLAAMGAVAEEDLLPKPMVAPDANGAGGVASRFSTWFALTDDSKTGNGQVKSELVAAAPTQTMEYQAPMLVPQAPQAAPPSGVSFAPNSAAALAAAAPSILQALAAARAAAPGNAPPLSAPPPASPPTSTPVQVHAVLAASAHAALSAAPPPAAAKGPTSPSLLPLAPATPTSPPLGHAPKPAPNDLALGYNRGPAAPGEFAHAHAGWAGQAPPMPQMFPPHLAQHQPLHHQHQHSHQHLHQHQHQHQHLLHQHLQHSPQFMQHQGHPHAMPPPPPFQHPAHQHLQHAGLPPGFDLPFRGAPPLMPPPGGKGAPAGPPNGANNNLAFLQQMQQRAMQGPGSHGMPPNVNPPFNPQAPPFKQPSPPPSSGHPVPQQQQPQLQQQISPFLLKLAQLNPQAQQQPMPQPAMGLKVPPSGVKEGGYDVSSLFQLLGGRPQAPPGRGGLPQGGMVLTAEEFEKQFTGGR
eukprot:EG_transcript_2415